MWLPQSACRQGNLSVLLAPSMWLQHLQPSSASAGSNGLGELHAQPAVASLDCRPGCHTPSNPWPRPGSTHPSCAAWSAHLVGARPTAALEAAQQHTQGLCEQMQEAHEQRVLNEGLQQKWRTGCRQISEACEAAHRPQGMAAVSDWVSCLAAGSSGTCVLAGTFSGQLLVLS